MRAALLLIPLCGCATWRDRSLAPATLVQKEEPDRLQVRCRSGAVVELASPRVDGDSLRGVAGDGPRAIALADIDRVAVRQGAGWIVFSVTFALTVGILAWASAMPRWQ